MSDGELCRVHFRVRAETPLGQSVGVGGNAFPLGHFDKSKVVALVTTPESYPVWFTTVPIVLPRRQLVHYKYCVMENGSCKAFENLSSPRTFIPENTDTLLEDFFDPQNVQDSTIDFDPILLNKLSTLTKTDHKRGDSLGNEQLGGHLFIVCYHLPVIVKRSPETSSFNVTWAESLIAKSDDSVATSIETFWIGTVTVSGEDLNPSEKDNLMAILKSMNCIPVFISPEIAKDAYLGYCKQVMWPIFHNVDPLDHIHAAWRVSSETGLLASTTSPDGLIWNTEASEAWWSAYKAVNEACVETLVSSISPTDTIWVHDYHLMLTPKLLRNRSCTNSIIYFLHIPFPTSQIFRSLASGDVLLQSMCCADVVGFHTFDFGRHFLQATKRMLGYKSHTRPGGLLAITVGDREAIVTMSHVSVEPALMQRAMESPEALKIAESIRTKYRGKKIILGIDVCQRLSGLALKFSGFEKMLEDYEERSRQVVLIQRAIMPGAREGDESITSSELRKICEQLNIKYGSAGGDVVVDYEEMPSLTLNQRVGLYLAADAFLLTCIREGLNLMPLEYIFARQNLPDAGVVIASEFSACCSLLNGALKINPFSPQLVADTIDSALDMAVDDKARRRQRDLPFISSRPSASWTRQILDELQQLKMTTGRREIIPLPKLLTLDDSICNAYKQAKSSPILQKASRVFILDYGGTIIAKERLDITHKQSLSAISGRRPTERMTAAIQKLSEDESNAVLVITGLTRAKLGGIFNKMKNVTIATSIGLVHSWGENIKTEEEKSRGLSVSYLDAYNKEAVEGEAGARSWDCLDFDVDWNAVREIATPIITRFTARTNGTCQSPRIPGISWSYFGADPDFGEKQAAQLTLELEASLSMFDVKVVSLIQGSIEIVPKKLDKGVILNNFVDRVVHKRAGQLPYFAVVLGDDPSDDIMFQTYLNVMAKASPSSWASARSETADGQEIHSPGVRTYNITVGRRETAADYYLPEVRDVEEFLQTLSEL